MYASLNDSALWAKVTEGDKEALAFVYRTSFPALFRYGMKLQADESLVKDCIHDLFVTIWLSRERLSSTDSIKYYLLASLKRRISAQLQKNAVDSFEDVPETVAISASPEENIIREQAGQELQLKLVKMMGQLPPRQQEILHLRFYEGLSPQETANIMDLSLNSSYVLLSKALNFLKKHSEGLKCALFIVIQLIHL
ncbi:RNA polymerase sigma factor [Chitinophaga sp. GCM10012297]|uniref:Sigma-70 family RNA polymerase sigma factor n=1 Tax=Chitinophaga chungangae TaxID=2821488 RepID=A0ABS3YFW8_9BACT|nr:sigma-70 family RNA polymerase sigma factor [Chitinophaga chungangae]MBO9153573.1 sigma-70 family RNA polymerase sigma factor [Chitinophaga chungangae]